MSGASVTVVIPAFNCEKWVRDAIESALGQTERPLEVIVVDDGSTDGTGGVIAEYGAPVRSITQPNRGVAAARNAGLDAARGGFIAFLDADDAWHPRKLELQLRALAEHPGIGVLGTGVFNWPARVLPSVGGGGSALTVVAREDLMVRNYLAVSSVMVRREVALTVGGFDARLQGAADYDYWLRAAEVCAVGRLEASLTGYRPVAGSMSRQPAAMEADMRRVLRKLDERDAWRGDRVLRRRAYSYLNFSSAYMYGASGRYAAAVLKVLRSFAWYPLPYTPTEAGATLARPKRLAVLVLRLVGVMSPDPGC